MPSDADKKVSMSEDGGQSTIEEKEVIKHCSGFADERLESLYLEYSARQKYGGLRCYLCASILFDIYLIAVPSGKVIPASLVGALFLVVNVALIIVANRYRSVAPHAACVTSIIQVAVHVALRAVPSAHEGLGWAILAQYMTCVALPLRLHICALYSCIGGAAYLLVAGLVAIDDGTVCKQLVANAIFLLTASGFGILASYLDDRLQRRAFLETRQSLEVKLIIEEQSAEQERLLLSVLPEHVAVKMRQDLGATDTQFKKIYMSRHENVSILYADIVGFTAISSTYSAQDLVAILNELFARFDRLAEKYQQLRIKILGDCYYCISGAPVERPEHAVLCVHMGLSMVKAIKYVQQTTNSPVDMRVGIHTGAVLAGVLGQRQWQFDVYSKDVELANKMESSGMAGKVHISEVTLGFLDGAFEVEPAHGEKREESLRQAGIKTFFITKVLKPYQPSKLEQRNGGSTDTEVDGIASDTPSELKDEVVKTPEGEEKETNTNKDSEDFTQRLREEIMSKEDHKTLSEQTTWSLRFREGDQEEAYATRGGGAWCTVALIVLPPAIFGALRVVSKASSPNFAAFGAVAATLICGGVALFAMCRNIFMKNLCVSTYPRWLGAATLFAIMQLITFNGFDMYLCARYCENNASTITSLSANGTVTSSVTFETAADGVRKTEMACRASYHAHAAAAIGAAAALAAALELWLRAAALLFSALFTAVALAAAPVDAEDGTLVRLAVDLDDSGPFYITPGKISLGILMLIITISLILIAIHVERRSRLRWLGGVAVAARRERATDMRRRNAALVRNVLPPRVAAHFLGRRRRIDELYSESVSAVGVLFASMPNFSDFYSEESVNNQGLECLRFLNEVISDFDALLDKPQYQEIIKIKTIGSTYMGASGLNPSKQVKIDDPVAVRWAHLALLVEFALEMKQILQGINEQSFNHFVLKMGINHGPITAGVIGARKPHYDIWGNTVNVASRMESTGKAGCIQVTEETCQILQQFDYVFEQRGLVAVKGKGQLMTYYLQGKSDTRNGPVMATLKEEDESVVTESTLDIISIPKVEVKSPNSSVGTKRTECNGLTSPKLIINGTSIGEEEEDATAALLTDQSELSTEPKENEALLPS